MTLRTTRSAFSRLLALSALLAAMPPALGENGVEPIFAAARGYTAYVRARIGMPFIEDE